LGSITAIAMHPMWIEGADGARLASAAWRGCLT
jgi:hypothetical protein